MSLHWTIDPQQRLVTAVADGDVTRAEFEAFLDAVRSAGADGYRKLFDGLRGDTQMSSEELLALEGMDETTAYALAAREVSTVDDLADLAVDDLIDIEGMNEERAAALIMAARAPMLERMQQESR